ncbi:DUF2490 domain-containing protein [Mangrovimonas aestuarii]|uniref:DUF2490 domain-containing protein n=1 Tax=Mangrovimonas aestuarii TaxID=3018443 RepID=UPI002378181B|nr:DUF2490 domain-containing protein [Mangrovimonas aestuarii]
MKKRTTFFFAVISFLFCSYSASSQIDEDKLGAWYMYFWNTTLKESSWGFQGDVQYRNWNLMGDLEQLLLRGGVTYKPENANVKFTLGYAHITTGDYGTDNDDTTSESRIYQEALLPQKVGGCFYLTHRFRFEQRFVEDQDFRTRYRYNLFVNVPLNKKIIEKNSIYLALYNELFINGQRQIGDGRSVELFDRNRTYVALGCGIKDNLRVQFGVMRQVTNSWSKDQLQLSLHHKF